jgi:hypothetical protein
MTLITLAQAPATAELKGVVTDPRAAVVTGATVTVVHEDKRTTRTVTTNQQGEYQLLSLPPGSYEVKVEQQGFTTQVKHNVSLTVGQVAALDFQLQVGPTTEIFEVTTDVPLIETERTHQSETIAERYIRNLPIDRRDYLSFTLLAPGISDSNAFADNSDFRVAQTPQSGLSFYGSNGRGNNVTVDGAEANDAAGGVRPTLGQEAVQEFQINRSNYTAELGGASGGVINIVSKSGGNELRGSIFGFFRHDRLDAADPFAVVLVGDRPQRTKPPSSRQQYGGTLGFPLQKDRTFFFGSFEKLNKDERASVPVLTDLSIFQLTAPQAAIISQLAANTSTTPVPCLPSVPTAANLPPAACAQALRGALATPQTTVDLFRRNSGIFPFVTNNLTFSTRLDHHIGDSDHLFFRYSFADNAEVNPNLRALVGFTRGNTVDGWDSNTVVGWNHTFSPQLINETRVQWNYREFNVRPNDPIGPELNLAGFGFFNRDIFLPSFTTERRYQIADSVTYSRAGHHFKFGGEILARGNNSESHTFFSGRFNFGTLPGGAVSPQLATTAVTALQAFNLGLPQFYQQGFGEPSVSSTIPYYAVYAQDRWNVRPNFTLSYGLRYEVDDRRDPMPTDTNNFAPRVGFAWDPWKDRKTTIRGGYGIYYSPIYYQIDYVVNALGVIDGFRQIAQIFVPLTGAPIANPQTGRALTSSDIFRTLRAQGVIGRRPLVASDLTQFGVNVTQRGPIPPLSVVFSGSSDYVNAYSQQASLGIDRQLSNDWGVSANYIFSRTLKITRARDKNLLPTAPIGPLGIRQWNAPPCATNPTVCFASPLILQENVYESTGRAFYHGFILEINKRLSHHVSFAASYTVSKAIDEVTDYNSDFQPNDQTNLRAERALSAFDQRHKVVIYAMLQSPFSAASHPAGRVFANFVVTPVFRSNSSRPFNLLTGVDTNGDRHSTTDRPLFVGRNTGRGPDFWTMDLRLARHVRLGSETRSVELMFEAFNLFNRLNFASVNNTVAQDFRPASAVEGRRDRRPSEPLGFTSAFDARRIQLGFRLNF